MKNYPILIIISFSLSLLLVFLLDWPRYQEFQNLEMEIVKAREELRSQESYYQEINRITDELVKYQDVLAVIDSALPEDHSLPELLNFIQRAASQSGLVVNQVSPFTITSDLEPDIVITRVNINMDGDYIDLKEFLHVVERSARFIEVNNVAFIFPEDESVFNFLVTVTVYQHK
jgi:Tfp pilus assembly protein PilO